MKTILFSLLCISTLTHSLIAQDQDPMYNKTFATASLSSIFVETEYASLEVIVEDRTDISVEGFSYYSDEKLYGSFSIESEIVNNRLKVISDLDQEKLEGYNSINSNYWDVGEYEDEEEKEDDRVINIANKKYTWKDSKYHKNRLHIKLLVRVKIPQNLKLETETLYGSNKITGLTYDANINATYGSIDCIVSSMNNISKLNFDSTYGTVDIAMPENASADINLKTGYGKIFSDLDLNPDIKEKSGANCYFGEDIKAKYNGGKTDLVLHSGYANIYLRKS